VYEELFSREGFAGPSSLLYHRHIPEAVQDVVEGDADDISMENEKVHQHALLQGFRLPAHGDAITGRQWLLVNDDIRIGLLIPQRQQKAFLVDGSPTTCSSSTAGRAPSTPSSGASGSTTTTTW